MSGKERRHERRHHRDYDRVTAADIAEFTRYLAELRYGHPRADNPTEARAVPGPQGRPAHPDRRPAHPHRPRLRRTRPPARPRRAQPPPSRPPSNFRTSGWGQLTGELRPRSSHPVGPDQRRTPGPVLVDTATLGDRDVGAAPVSTAHTPIASTVSSRCRHPRAFRGSATPANATSRSVSCSTGEPAAGPP